MFRLEESIWLRAAAEEFPILFLLIASEEPSFTEIIVLDSPIA